MKKLFTKSFFLISLALFAKCYGQDLSLPAIKSGVNTTITTQANNRVQNKRFYVNGSVKEIRESIDKKLDGSWKYFYSNGQLMKEGFFKNSKADGAWKIYNKKGNLVSIENYKNGMEQGIWKAFHSDGTLKIEGFFVNGKRQGKWKVYNPSGNLTKIVTFKDDIEKNELILDHKPSEVNFYTVKQLIGNY